MLWYAMLNIVGYSEDGDALLLTVSFGGCATTYSFMLQLEPLEWTNLNQRFLEYSYHPFAYFYTASNCLSLYYKSCLNLLVWHAWLPNPLCFEQIFSKLDQYNE